MAELVDSVPARVLAVYAHPDDPEISCGGTLARWAEGGSEVHVLICTRGEKGSPDSKFAPIGWDEALEIIAKKLLALRDADEARAVASKTSGRLPRGVGPLIGRLFALLGSPNDTDVGPVCNDAGGNALAWTFGLRF